jgi:hypothetical protein
VPNSGYLAAIVVVIGIAAHLAFDLSRAGTPWVFVILGVPTVTLAVLGVLRAHRDGVLRSWLSVRGGDFSRGFAAAAVLFAGAYAFSKVVTPPGSTRSIWLVRLYLQLGDPAVLRKHVALVVLGIIVVSIAEELVWRGLVIALLEEKIGSRRAWVWAAALYALASVPTMWVLGDPAAGPNPTIVLASLAGGLVWGGMARRYERLLPGIFSHVLFDWTVLMMFRLWGPSV